MRFGLYWRYTISDKSLSHRTRTGIHFIKKKTCVLQYCVGGSAVELVNRLHAVNKKVSEEHIAFMLRETCKALVFLHKNHAIHRDVRGNNILITAEGEIKLCDFGLSRDLKTTLGRRSTVIGSPCWMAPEVFTTSKPKRVVDEEEEYADEDEEDQNVGNYGSRADVWALGNRYFGRYIQDIWANRFFGFRNYGH